MEVHASLGRYALLIGINENHESYGNLTGPEDEVKALAEVLKKPNVGQFDVKIAQEKTGYELRDEIHDFFAKRTAKDLLFFYFAGHGDLDRGGRFHFVTTDAVKGRVHTKGISARYLKSEMEDSNVEKQIVILNCCFSGQCLEEVRGDMAAQMATELASGTGQFIMASSGEYEVSRKEPSALFTKALLEGLEGKADRKPTDGTITMQKLLDYIIDEMKGAGQTPRKNIKADGTLVIAYNPDAPKHDSTPPEVESSALSELQSFQAVYIRHREKGTAYSASLTLEGLRFDDERVGILSALISGLDLTDKHATAHEVSEFTRMEHRGIYMLQRNGKFTRVIIISTAPLGEFTKGNLRKLQRKIEEQYAEELENAEFLKSEEYRPLVDKYLYTELLAPLKLDKKRLETQISYLTKKEKVMAYEIQRIRSSAFAAERGIAFSIDDAQAHLQHLGFALNDITHFLLNGYDNGFLKPLPQDEVEALEQKSMADYIDLARKKLSEN